MDINNVIVFLSCIICIFLFGKIFVVPFKILFKIIFNSILGGIIICFINLIGNFYNFHIGLNILTTLIIGILGIPGAILLIILKIFL